MKLGCFNAIYDFAKQKPAQPIPTRSNDYRRAPLISAQGVTDSRESDDCDENTKSKWGLAEELLGRLFRNIELEENQA